MAQGATAAGSVTLLNAPCHDALSEAHVPLGADAVCVMNVYEVLHTDGRSREVEADFFESEDVEWVFFAGNTEVFRVCRLDVVCVGKSPLRPRATEAVEQLWLRLLSGEKMHSDAQSAIR